MASLDHYLDAATRENTRSSYAAARRHFEEEWGGCLPASAEAIARYLAHYAPTLSTNTLRHRLAALSRWHAEHGFHDPTRDPLIRQTLRGIRAVHGRPEKRATPLQLDQLAAAVAALDRALLGAEASNDRAAALRAARDRALLLLGFWRGFRGDELVRLAIEHVVIVPAKEMTIYLPHSKGDRGNAGRTLVIPALSRLCPVHAVAAWLALAGVTRGPLFRAIDRWGRLADDGLHPDSVITLLRRILATGGIVDPASYSGHSLRRGLAGWANANGWDVKTLMEYVGWSDLNSALRYIDATPASDRARIEAGLRPATADATPAAVPAGPVAPPKLRLQITLHLQRYGIGGRGLTAARRHIEQICLARHSAQPVREDGSRFDLWCDIESPDGTLDDRIADLLDELHRIADNHQCYLEASLVDPESGQTWD